MSAAWKGNRVIYLSVKDTSGHKIPHWQIGGFSKKGKKSNSCQKMNSVFTILVGMAMKREDDQFYVVPTHECACAMSTRTTGIYVNANCGRAR